MISLGRFDDCMSWSLKTRQPLVESRLDPFQALVLANAQSCIFSGKPEKEEYNNFQQRRTYNLVLLVCLDECQ